VEGDKVESRFPDTEGGKFQEDMEEGVKGKTHTVG
jgi:hypothetical protein